MLAIPFVLTNDAVAPITETAYGEMGGWKGYLEGVSWGLYIDFALLLIFGGIPWQVCKLDVVTQGWKLERTCSKTTTFHGNYA